MSLSPKSCYTLAALSAAILTAVPAAAQQKIANVGLDHYSGTWLEIARRPMWLTDGCVAGYTTYKMTKSEGPGAVSVEDGCRTGTPQGSLKTVHGDGRIIDFGGSNARLHVKYPLFITFDYNVLYKSPDKQWFISADPKMENLWIYSRYAPSKRKLDMMVRKAAALGYDVKKLEFPAPATMPQK
ncbi:lipocalin family protein [Oryzifoliimicrobium ureilyticus]|uniref:lipocalin family protein n=1 Tax=Oryzifoliimicrobium ureilyticus TaxID=3113724 RepID=UPI00307645BE